MTHSGELVSTGIFKILEYICSPSSGKSGRPNWLCMGVPTSVAFASRAGVGASSGSVILYGAEQSHYCGWSTCQKDYSRSLYLMYNFLILHKTIALGLQSLRTDRVWPLVAVEERQKAQNKYKYCKLLLLLLVFNNRKVYHKSWFTEVASCQSQESKYAGF